MNTLCPIINMKNLYIILLFWSASLAAQDFDVNKKSLKRAKTNNRIIASEMIEKHKVWKAIALYDYKKKEFFDFRNKGVTISFVDSFFIIWGEHNDKLNIVNDSKFEILFPHEGGEKLYQ